MLIKINNCEEQSMDKYEKSFNVLARREASNSSESNDEIDCDNNYNIVNNLENDVDDDPKTDYESYDDIKFDDGVNYGDDIAVNYMHNNSPSIATATYLHRFSDILTHHYCFKFTQILRDANICKVHSNRLISLIKSALPEPNNVQSSLGELLTILNIEDMFLKRQVCLLCQRELLYNETACKYCQSPDLTSIATVFDTDPARVLPILLKRLQPYTEEYKKQINEKDDFNNINDLPFGLIYKKLMKDKLVKCLIAYLQLFYFSELF